MAECGGRGKRDAEQIRRSGLGAREVACNSARRLTKRVELAPPPRRAAQGDTVTAGLFAVNVKLLFRNNRNSYAPGVVGIVTVHVRVV